MSRLFDRIGVDINQKLPLERAIAWAIEHKVRYIDLCLDQTPELLEKSSPRLASARRHLEANGIQLGLHTLSAVNIAETSPFVTSAADAYLAAYLDAASKLGAGWIVVHGGYHFTSDKKARMEAAVARANNVEDAWLMLAFGVLGWLMKRYDWSAAPMILGLVLGPIFESALRQSLTLSHGSAVIFVTRPISATLLAFALLAVTAPLWMRLFRAKAL